MNKIIKFLLAFDFRKNKIEKPTKSQNPNIQNASQSNRFPTCSLNQFPQIGCYSYAKHSSTQEDFILKASQ